MPSPARDVFQGLWEDFDTIEVPITSITNGVHHLTWVHRDLLDLLEAPTGSSSETVIDGYDWAALEELDGATIWELKRKMRADLVAMARRRLTDSSAHRGLATEWANTVLDADIVTFGFARRVPSYKRLTLMLRDPSRLKALLTNEQRPIQIVIAGKSHPADEGGKALIQQMVQFADDPDVRHRIVFPPGLRHVDGQAALSRVRRVDEQSAAPVRGVRNLRHEGRSQRGGEPVNPRRLVG